MLILPLQTTVGSLALVLVQLLPKVCTAEHLSNPPTKAAIQYLSSALNELAGVGAIRVGTFRTVNLSTAEIGCRQLHIFALVMTSDHLSTASALEGHACVLLCSIIEYMA